MFSFSNIKTFIIKLLYENGEPSLTRCVAIFVILSAVLLPIGVTVYLLATGKPFTGYSDMLNWSRDGILGGGGIQAFNKFVNSKHNSSDGEFPSKNPIITEHKDGE